MSDSEQEQRRQVLDQMRREVARLEAELAGCEVPATWVAQRFYGAFYVMAGFVLGGVAAMASLLFNVTGATVAGEHPLRIIGVYLTFPLGEQALRLTSAAGMDYVIDDSVILALGCCLYIGTGMVFGVVFHTVISMLSEGRPLVIRVIVGTLLGVLVWGVNYYGILVWLQPLLFGGRWITDNSILPWWVALSTHVVFGWTMAVISPLGAYVPYRRPTD